MDAPRERVNGEDPPLHWDDPIGRRHAGSEAVPFDQIASGEHSGVPRRRRHENGHRFKLVYRVRRWMFPLFMKSLTAAAVVVLTTSAGGAYGFLYGAITGPKTLRAHAKENNDQWEAIRDLRVAFTAFQNERDESKDFIYWMASKECGRIPPAERVFGTDAAACGRISNYTGGLFRAPPPPDR